MVEQNAIMEIIVGTAASVATTIFTVLGAIFYLVRKMDANRREVSVEIKDVRQASQNAHTDIRADLSDIKSQQAAHTERLKCIESHLNVSRPQ